MRVTPIQVTFSVLLEKQIPQIPLSNRPKDSRPFHASLLHACAPRTFFISFHSI